MEKNNIFPPKYEEFHTRVVFYRIPKNAGTSICTHLSHINYLNFHKRDLRDKVQDPTYLKPDEFKDLLVGENLRNYFSFCVVRNPWDRVVSAYLSSERKDSFDSYCFKESENIFDIGKQVEWTTGKYPPQEILRFENLTEDFKKMVRNRGLVCVDPNIPHKNKTNHDHYSKYYSRETRDLIYNIFKEDIDSFGYKFTNNKIQDTTDKIRI